MEINFVWPIIFAEFYESLLLDYKLAEFGIFLEYILHIVVGNAEIIKLHLSNIKQSCEIYCDQKYLLL